MVTLRVEKIILPYVNLKYKKNMFSNHSLYIKGVIKQNHD